MLFCASLLRLFEKALSWSLSVLHFALCMLSGGAGLEVPWPAASASTTSSRASVPAEALRA